MDASADFAMIALVVVIGETLGAIARAANIEDTPVPAEAIRLS